MLALDNDTHVLIFNFKLKENKIMTISMMLILYK
jgi:hypothetical protein